MNIDVKFYKEKWYNILTKAGHDIERFRQEMINDIQNLETEAIQFFKLETVQEWLKKNRHVTTKIFGEDSYSTFQDSIELELVPMVRQQERERFAELVKEFKIECMMDDGIYGTEIINLITKLLLEKI